jgi:hypothetical protein
MEVESGATAGAAGTSFRRIAEGGGPPHPGDAPPEPPTRRQKKKKMRKLISEEIVYPGGEEHEDEDGNAGSSPPVEVDASADEASEEDDQVEAAIAVTLHEADCVAARAAIDEGDAMRLSQLGVATVRDVLRNGACFECCALSAKHPDRVPAAEGMTLRTSACEYMLAHKAWLLDKLADTGEIPTHTNDEQKEALVLGFIESYRPVAEGGVQSCKFSDHCALRLDRRSEVICQVDKERGRHWLLG